MRHAQRTAFEELAVLTRLKEMAALENVARASLELRTLDREIKEMGDHRPDANGTGYARFIDKWMLWRQEELRRLNLRKARLKAELIGATAVLGRARAEHDVAKNLSEKARAAERRLTEQRKGYIS